MGIKESAGRFISKLGGMASLVAGKDIRLGGGQGAGARIAGRTEPFFSVKAAEGPPIDYSQYQSKITPP